MIIQQIIGNKVTHPVDGLEIDLLEIEWFETTKRIQRKNSNSGMEIAIKFIQEGQRLHQDDILYQDDKKVVLVHIKPCEAIVMTPASLLEMGTICYEIGNKHLPLFIQDDKIMMPFEMPMFRWLEASGYFPEKQELQLLHLLKSNVAPHGHGNTSLFTKILNIASSND
ncbi:urease accessory protein UreE [Flavobacterium sp. W1B]|uniref:urease accessory protein UreE n=1 Tax=Flavobacterium sp. W1B TaxID=3394146 RepID=UPI0039BD0097